MTTTTTVHALSNIDSDISNVLPQQLHVNIPIQGDGNDQSAYLRTEFIDNKMHSVAKRKANHLMRTSMINTSPPRPGQISLVLVFDATESMSNDLHQLRQGAEKMFDKFAGLENNPIYNYIFVPFREENGTIG